MNTDAASTLSSEQAEAVLRQRLYGRVWHLRVQIREEGVVLQGVAVNYYGKQMTQHLAQKLLGLPILANEMEVRASAALPQDDPL
jgi:hypothetical protein